MEYDYFPVTPIASGAGERITLFKRYGQRKERFKMKEYPIGLIPGPYDSLFHPNNYSNTLQKSGQ